VDVDQALSYPNAAECIITSAEKKLVLAVSTDIQKIVDGTMDGGDDHWDATRDGLGFSPFHDNEDVFPEGFADQLNEALAQMKAGELQTCPDPGCGSLDAL
jgi:basic membrane protein A